MTRAKPHAIANRIREYRLEGDEREEGEERGGGGDEEGRGEGWRKGRRSTKKGASYCISICSNNTTAVKPKKSLEL